MLTLGSLFDGIGVFPLAYLGIGVVVALRRRRLQNEPV